MSSLFRGRRVTDPKPVVRGPLADRNYDSSLNDLEKAWDKMGKTKTAFRRVQHRIDDASAKYKLRSLQEESDVSVTENNMPNFEEMRVDSYSRNQPLRSKGTRKVSRLEDKYTEGYADRYRSRSPIQSAYSSSKEDLAVKRPTGSPPRRVGFSDRPEYREIESRKTSYMNRDGSSLTYSNDYPSYRLSQESSSNQTNNLTDSRAVRETEIRFLNDEVGSRSNEHEHDWRKYTGSTRFSHVDVTVPGSTYKPTTTWTNTQGYTGAGTTYSTAHGSVYAKPLDHGATYIKSSAEQGRYGSQYTSNAYVPKGTSAAPYDDPGNVNYGVRGSGLGNYHYDVPIDVPKKIDSQADTSLDSGTSGGSTARKLRKSLKDITESAGGLAKVKERIEQQRLRKMASSRTAETENQYSTQKVYHHENEPLKPPPSSYAPEQPKITGCEDLSVRTHHLDSDPVQSKAYDIYETDKHATVVRKVASGPPVPVYKGFNEVETKIKTPDGKVFKVSEVVRKSKRKGVKTLFSEITHDKNSDKAPSKPKKTHRVIAPKKKPSKFERKDIITASSWRAGQKAVLRELGPNKLLKRSPPAKDKDPSSTSESTSAPKISHDSPIKMDTAEKKDETDESDHDNLEPTNTKALSEDAKHILADLKSDSEGEDSPQKEGSQESTPEKGPKKYMSKKRKAPRLGRLGEEKKSMPVAKVRHYDSDEVRKYIKKQKAERKQRMLNQKQQQRQAMETKNKKLQELYHKQKQSVRPGKPRQGSPGKSKVNNETFVSQAVSLEDLPRRHPFHDDSKRSNESDKENQHRSEDSSDSSTLTGDSMDEKTLEERSGQQGVDDAETKSTSSDTTMSLDEMLKKYVKPDSEEKVAMQGGKEPDVGMEIDYKQSAAYQQGFHSGPLGFNARGYGANQPSRSAAVTTNAKTGGYGVPTQPRSRDDRIAALKEMSVALQSRLQEETRRFQQTAPEYGTGANTHAEQRWAYPRYKDFDVLSSASDSDFVTRQQRITGAKDDYTVFKDDLPGVKDLGLHALSSAQEKEEIDAATKIQAAYRGHTVRQGLSWRGLKNVAGVPKQDTEFKALLSDESMDTSSLLTEDSESDIEYGASRKIGTGLTKTEYCAGEPFKHKDSDSFASLENMKTESKPKKLGWDEPSADPYSVINIFTRQYKQAKSSSLRPVSPTHRSPTPVYEDDFTVSQHSRAPISQRTTSSTSQHSKLGQRSWNQKDTDHQLSGQSRSPVASYRSDFTGSQHSYGAPVSAPAHSTDHAGRGVSESQRSRSIYRILLRGKYKYYIPKTYLGSKSEDLKLKPSSVLKQDIPDKDHDTDIDDTLEGSLTHSYESEEDKSTPKPSPSPKTSHDLSLVRSKMSKDDSMDSDLSSLGDEECRRDPLSLVTSTGKLSPRPFQSDRLPARPSRLSPNALERRMTAELNRLEGMEESIRQLGEVDRTRAVALAQQESVSLAQVLKGRQQQHDREFQALQMKVRQETLDATRQIEEARQKAAEASQNAARAIAEVRGETTVRIQESTQRLIETQAEAAKATAEAAKQLAGAKLAAVSQTAALQVHDANKLATEAAAAAASAAVTATLDQQRQQQVDFWRQMGHHSKYDRSIQTSVASRAASKSPPSASYTGESFDSITQSVSEKLPSVSASIKTTSEYSARRPESRDIRSTASIKTVTPSVSASIKTESVKTGSIKTASGVGDKDEHDRTLTESMTEEIPTDKSESVTEEILTDKERGNDYSMKFDESLTEEEIEDQSFRAVLPSETHRKKMKKDDHPHSDMSSDELHLSEDITVPFGGEDSFNKFTAEMVRQYMKEEEMRAKHQAAMFKLREHALKEKTQAELAWLEQQKKRLRSKGEDDAYPQIRKKQRGLIMRLQQEQAQLKRLREANRVASRERHLLILQQQEIQRLKQTAQQVKEKLKTSKTKDGGETQSEDEISIALDLQSDMPEQFSTQESVPMESRSDSELGTEPSAPPSHRSPSPSPADARILRELKKMKLDKRHLTVREQKLQERRKQAEELLEWKKRLDKEEAEIYQMEKQVQELWEGDRKKGGKEKSKKKETESRRGEKKEPSAERSPVPPVIRSPATRSIRSPGSPSARSPGTPSVSEQIMTESISKDDSRVRGSGSESSIAEDLASPSGKPSGSESSMAEDVHTDSKGIDDSQKSHRRSGSESSIAEDIPSEKEKAKTHHRSGSESSVPEEVLSRSSSMAEEINTAESPLEKHRPNDSSDDTLQNGSVPGDYSNDFESSQDQTMNSKKENLSSKSSKASALRSRDSMQLSLRSPFSARRRSSESESEDSFSHTQSETASDQSDAETQIRALREELKRRKIEAERLKKEQKKRHKERLRAQEASLKKQIEAYDNVISQIKTELQRELELEPHKPYAKPKIIKPGADKKSLKKQQEIISKPAEPVKQRSDSGSSKSSVEENKDDSYTSFSNDTSRQQTPSPLRTDALNRSDPLNQSKRSSLASISESSESPTPSPTKRESPLLSFRKRSIEEEHSRSGSEIGEDVPEEIMSPRSEGVVSEHLDHSGDVSLKLASLQRSISEQAPQISRPDSRRTESALSTDIPEEVSVKSSVKSPGSYSDDFSETDLSPRKDTAPADSTFSPEPSAKLSARSIQSEIQEDVQSQKSDVSTVSQPSVVSPEPSGKISARSVQSEIQFEIQEDLDLQSQKSDASASSQRSVASAHSKASRVSERSEKLKLEKQRSRSGSEASEASYSEDFSDSSAVSEKTVSSHHSVKSERSVRSEKSIKSDRSVRSEKSVKSERSVRSAKESVKSDKGSVIESIHSEDDISEQLSIQSDTSDRSVQMLDLTGDKHKFDEDEDKTPVQSPSWLTREEPRILDSSTPVIKDPFSDYSLGDRVLVEETKPGTLCFKGPVDSLGPGIFGGVELDDTTGDNDGYKNGKFYFKCKPGHGLFVTAEQLKHLPDDFKLKDDEISEAIEEVASEHTLTEGIDEQKSLEYSDDFSEHKSTTPRSETATEGESITSDDRKQLDDAISSAAQVIESMAMSPPGTPDEDKLNTSAGITPRELAESGIPELPQSPSAKTFEHMVDTITDSITVMIVKDSVEHVSKIAEKQSRGVQERKAEQQEIQLKSDKPHTPLLDLLTREQEELDRSGLSSFEQEFQKELAASPEPPSPRQDVAQKTKEDKSIQAASIVTNKLLNEAIGDMLKIRKHQRDRLAAETQTEQSFKAAKPDVLTLETPQSPTSPVRTPVTPDSDHERPTSAEGDYYFTDDMLDTRITVETSQMGREDGQTPIPRPVSPVFREPAADMGQSALDMLEDFSADHEWMDDDLIGYQRQIPNKPPPPYPGPAGGLPRQDISKLELQKLTEELFYAVPHKEEEILKLVSTSIDALWNARRYGEPFDSVEAPTELFDNEDSGKDIESNSKRVFKQMLFEFVGDIIQDIYKDEEDVELLPWEKPKRVIRKYFKGKNPPTTRDSLRDIVNFNIITLLHLSSKTDLQEKLGPKVGGRKKKDIVDMILVQELREDEPSWVNYDDDELAVKMQLTDAIFDSLLSETTSVMSSLIQTFKRRSETR